MRYIVINCNQLLILNFSLVSTDGGFSIELMIDPSKSMAIINNKPSTVQQTKLCCGSK